MTGPITTPEQALGAALKCCDLSPRTRDPAMHAEHIAAEMSRLIPRLASDPRIAALRAEQDRLREALAFIRDWSLTVENAEDAARAALEGGGDG